MDTEAFRLGTRGSALARSQAEAVSDAIADHRATVKLVEVSTQGDRLPEDRIRRLGRVGAFVRDLDDRVLSADLDAAVHSLKDMPTQIPEDLVVAIVPERGPAHDVLVTPTGERLDELPTGAIVGTSSLRRRAQLLCERPDLEIVPIRGNIDTRIEKLLAADLQRHRDTFDDSEELDEWLAVRTDLERAALDREIEHDFDALVLAGAGIDRAGLTNAAAFKPLPMDRFVPAPGQGALAVTMRDTDHARRLHRQLDHPPSRVAVTVERTILSTLGGGCIAPIGVHAVVQGEVVRTRAQILSDDGTESIDTTRELPVEDHVAAAVRVASDLAEEGAKELIATAERSMLEGPDPP